MKTLEIVTRHMPARAGLLARNQARLAEQSTDDFVQTVITDHEGVGVNRAGSLLSNHEPQAAYVWVLDDDDYVAHEDVVRQMVERLEIKQPDIMFVRFDHGYAVLPDNWHWRIKPLEGRIGGSSIIASADIWSQCRGAWDVERYESDFSFIDACYDAAFVIDWYDITAACADRQRMGAAE